MDNENKNYCDCAIPLNAENTFNGCMPTESEKSAMELRLLMAGKEGEEKCTLCRAASCLENGKSKQTGSWLESCWMFLLLWAGSDFSKDAGFTEAFCRNYLEAVEKRRKEEEENAE